MPSAAELKKLKVAELKELLQQKGLDTSGVKDVLIERLLSAEATPAGEEAAAEPAAELSAAAPAEPAPAAAEQKTQAAPAEAATEPPATDEEAPGDGAAGEDASAPAPTADAKMLARAARFGIPVVQQNAIGADEKKKARAERFGMALSPEEEAKKQARAARFGITETKAGGEGAGRSGAGLSEDALKRGARLGLPVGGAAPGAGEKKRAPAAAAIVDPEFEAKKKARAERFAALEAPAKA